VPQTPRTIAAPQALDAFLAPLAVEPTIGADERNAGPGVVSSLELPGAFLLLHAAELGQGIAIPQDVEGRGPARPRAAFEGEIPLHRTVGLRRVDGACLGAGPEILPQVAVDGDVGRAVGQAPTLAVDVDRLGVAGLEVGARQETVLVQRLEAA